MQRQPHEPGLGYTSVVSPLTIDRPMGGESRVLCKMAATRGGLTTAELSLAFDREVRAYRDALPALGLCPLAPVFFASCPGLLLLQDLGEEGFAPADGYAGLTPAQMDLALQVLGELHASSLLLREKDVDKWEYLTSSMDDFRFGVNAFNQWLDLSVTNAVAVLREAEEGRVANMLVSSPPPVSIQCSNPAFQVICHGDYWTNNLMFREEKSIRIIDFQNLSCGPVYKDLLTLVSTSSRFDTDVSSCFRSYFHHFRKAAGSPPNFPSYEDFRDHLQEGLGYGLRMGLLYLGARLMRHGTNVASTDDYREHLLHLINIYKSLGLFQS